MHTTPDNAFIPLTPGALTAHERPDFRVTVISQANAKPFAGAQQKDSWTSVARTAAHEPQVSLLRDGDRISGIRLQCVCGRTIELACEYDSATPSNPVSPPAAHADALPPKPS
jgi:hypothetical protein